MAKIAAALGAEFAAGEQARKEQDGEGEEAQNGTACRISSAVQITSRPVRLWRPAWPTHEVNRRDVRAATHAQGRVAGIFRQIGGIARRWARGQPRGEAPSFVCPGGDRTKTPRDQDEDRNDVGDWGGTPRQTQPERLGGRFGRCDYCIALPSCPLG